MENNCENKMTFEEALASLKDIVASLETGSAPLDESLALYEKGVGLVKLCNDMLDSAEQKVSLVNTDLSLKDGE